MDLARGNNVTPLIQTPFHETVLSFSPDGRHVAFLSNDSGRTEAYVQDFEGGEQPRVKGPRRQISRTGALYLRWRRDGREILYLGADSRIHGTKFQGGQPGATETLFRIDPEALSVLPNPTGFDVSADGQLLLVPVLAPGKRSALTVVQNWERLLENQGKR
jgi:dipeptidyl aminopeptidase/acylaminoacyl peptidase